MDNDLEAAIQRATPGAIKMALYAAKKQNFEVLKYTHEGVDSLCNSAALLKDFDDDQDHLSTLEETTKAFVVLEAQIARYKQTLERIESLAESGTFDPSTIEQMIDDSLVEPQLNVKQHELYKRFCDKAGVRQFSRCMYAASRASCLTHLPVCALDHRLSLGSKAMKTCLSKRARARAARSVLSRSSRSRSHCASASSALQVSALPALGLTLTDCCRMRLSDSPSCGHTYSEQGIRSHLQRSKKCPVAGARVRLGASLRCIAHTVVHSCACVCVFCQAVRRSSRSATSSATSRWKCSLRASTSCCFVSLAHLRAASHTRHCRVRAYHSKSGSQQRTQTHATAASAQRYSDDDEDEEEYVVE